MILLDATFRFSGVAMLVLLAWIVLASARNSLPHLFLCLASISVAGLFLGYTPDVFDLPEALKIAVRILDIPHLIFVWLLTLSLFQNDFTVTRLHWLIGGVYCVPIAVARFLQFTDFAQFPLWAAAISGVMSFAIAGHMVTTALLGRADDLSASGRASRICFSVSIAFVTVSAAGIELIFIGAWAVYLPTVKVLTIWPAIVWACVWLIQLKPNVFAFTTPAKKGMEKPEKRTRLSKALSREMIENHAYLESQLRIPQLAKRLGVTQHMLREHINHELGFRNFSDFVNFYRIEAVKRACEEDENRHKSILEIALDHGFNSLTPFNKAFKSQVGVTPSEFRSRLH